MTWVGVTRGVAALLLLMVLAASAGWSGNASGAQTRADGGTLNQVRGKVEQADAVIVRRAIRYETISGARLVLDAYLPATGSSHPGVIFVHGGGFRSGSRAFFAPGEQRFAPTGRTLARDGFAVFAIDYRLAPRFPFPAAEHDVLEAVRWVRSHAGRLRVDPKRLGLFGASAGGDLAALAATASHGALDAGGRVRVAVSWSGPMNLRSFYPAHPFVAEYLGCAPSACPARYRAASPVNHVSHSDPPMLLANGTAEIVPLEQARQMTARLRAAHVPSRLLAIPGDRHAGQYASTAFPATVRFLRRYLQR